MTVPHMAGAGISKPDEEHHGLAPASSLIRFN